VLNAAAKMMETIRKGARSLRRRTPVASIFAAKGSDREKDEEIGPLEPPLHHAEILRKCDEKYC
jgi:hypothetical protein